MGQTTQEQDPLPAARMHWARLVLGGSHPIIIILVLALVGAGVCWFSLDRISSLTTTPTRYEMNFMVTTQGCEDRALKMEGYIVSFNASALYLSLLDEYGNLVYQQGCWLKKILLGSNLALKPLERPEESRLFFTRGHRADVLQELAKEGMETRLSYQREESAQATTVGDTLKIVEQSEVPEHGPQFSLRVQEGVESTSIPQAPFEYEIRFSEHWQPTSAGFNFVVPESIYTSFNIYSGQENVSDDEPESSFKIIESRISFWTDEVSILRGSISDSGEATSVDGQLRFGIENNDAESKRENGNVRYSAVLGIGIALLVEAFVILLAIAIRALTSRIAISNKSLEP